MTASEEGWMVATTDSENEGYKQENLDGKSMCDENRRHERQINNPYCLVVEAKWQREVRELL